jgi:hypothetical protein
MPPVERVAIARLSGMVRGRLDLGQEDGGDAGAVAQSAQSATG